MPVILPSDALRLAINVLRDVAESHKMPSGLGIDHVVADLHGDAADRLESSLEAIENTPQGGHVINALQPAHVPLADTNPDARYRLLVPEADTIEAGDEFLSEDTMSWAVDPRALFAGMIYGGRVLRPARRAIKS